MGRCSKHGGSRGARLGRGARRRWGQDDDDDSDDYDSNDDKPSMSKLNSILGLTSVSFSMQEVRRSRVVVVVLTHTLIASAQSFVASAKLLRDVAVHYAGLTKARLHDSTHTRLVVLRSIIVNAGFIMRSIMKDIAFYTRSRPRRGRILQGPRPSTAATASQ